jgi:uncharacterized protein with HEPN domain
MRSTLDRLKDVMTAIEHVETEAAHGRAAFDSDPKIQVWMVYHVQLIGEAVRSVSDELKALDPSTPWAQIVGMRHILVHNYFGVDLDEVWSVVENDIAPLKAKVSTLIAQLQTDASNETDKDT